MLDISKHVLSHRPLHTDSLSILKLKTSFATIPGQSCHLQLQFFIELSLSFSRDFESLLGALRWLITTQPLTSNWRRSWSDYIDFVHLGRLVLLCLAWISLLLHRRLSQRCRTWWPGFQKTAAFWWYCSIDHVGISWGDVLWRNWKWRFQSVILELTALINRLAPWRLGIRYSIFVEQPPNIPKQSTLVSPSFSRHPRSLTWKLHLAPIHLQNCASPPFIPVSQRIKRLSYAHGHSL